MLRASMKTVVVSPPVMTAQSIEPMGAPLPGLNPTSSDTVA